MESGGICMQLSSSTDTTFMACSSAETNFQVDDLLDFPNEDEEDDSAKAAAALGSPIIAHATANLLLAPPLSSATSIQSNLKAAAAPHEELSHGLCVPPDDLVHQLEWLSSFNEDNFFSGGDTKLQCSMETSSQASSDLTRCKELTPIATHNDFDNESPVSVLEHQSHVYALNHHVQRASRVRKARTSGRIWSLDILKPIILEERLKTSYENNSLLVTSFSSTFSEPLYSFLEPDNCERPHKKIKQVSPDDAAMDSVLVRKCTHCLVQKTPQWRAGPLGPKTLCNACGVRYKSGRLVPEYRPAASPSFVSEVHSNSHRRILEMRQAKEVEAHATHLKSKGERDYIKREACVMQQASKGTLESKEGSLSEVSVCEEAQVSQGDGICGESSSGSINSCISLCEAEIGSDESHVCEEGQTSNNALACEEKHMQDNVSACSMEVACEGKPWCDKVEGADVCAKPPYVLSKSGNGRVPRA